MGPVWNAAHLVERKDFETFVLLYRDALKLRLQPSVPSGELTNPAETEHSTTTKDTYTGAMRRCRPGTH
jgi:hypothetical protein